MGESGQSPGEPIALLIDEQSLIRLSVHLSSGRRCPAVLPMHRPGIPSRSSSYPLVRSLSGCSAKLVVCRVYWQRTSMITNSSIGFSVSLFNSLKISMPAIASTGFSDRKAGLSLQGTANRSLLVLGKICLGKASAQPFPNNLRSIRHAQGAVIA